MRPGCAPTGLLADYAAGTLSPGMSLVVASHLVGCPCCRDKTRRLESLGGCLLADASPVAPSRRCLAGALDRIVRPAAPEPPGHNPELPRPLCRRLAEPVRDLAWTPLAPGVETFRLDGFGPDRVRLVRARPGARPPRHDHSPTEATLVLAGRLRTGPLTLGPGDLALDGPGARPDREAIGPEPCLCLCLAVADGA